MKFLVDECTWPAVAEWLQELGHEVFSVYKQARGLEDEEILKKAYFENFIIITNDKDFGELAIRFKKLHKGILLLRLANECAENKIKILQKVLDLYLNKLINNFTIVTENTIRIIEKS